MKGFIRSLFPRWEHCSANLKGLIVTNGKSPQCQRVIGHEGNHMDLTMHCEWADPVDGHYPHVRTY